VFEEGCVEHERHAPKAVDDLKLPRGIHRDAQRLRGRRQRDSQGQATKGRCLNPHSPNFIDYCAGKQQPASGATAVADWQAAPMPTRLAMAASKDQLALRVIGASRRTSPGGDSDQVVLQERGIADGPLPYTGRGGRPDVECDGEDGWWARQDSNL
jgi:hypothetical protein